MVMGFLTREFVLADPTGQPRPMAAVYVPTNHLYLGDVLIFPRQRLQFPDLTVEDGIRIFLTGGMACRGRSWVTPSRRRQIQLCAGRMVDIIGRLSRDQDRDP